jgi:NADH-quinone oxidoreductase subunit E
VVTPAPRPLPRTGPIMRAPAEVLEDYPDDGRTIEPVVEEVRPPTLETARNSVPDDLKMIGGVGPKIEATLNTLGIYHFDQIAAWSPANAAWVEAHISFKGRVVRERWVEQARILARGGVTEAAEKYKRGEHI